MSSLLRLWKTARHASANQQARKKRRPQLHFRPRLESLEDRLAPATLLTWTGAAGNTSGADPNNWAEHRAPLLTAPFIPIIGDPPSTGPEYFDLFFPAHVTNRVCDFGTAGIAANSITFTDANYIIRGGNIDLGKPGITNFGILDGGTNTIEGSSITLDRQEPTSEAIPFWITGGTINVTADIADVSPSRELRQFGTGTLILSGNNHQDSTSLEDGTLIVGSTTALGNGPLKLVGGDTGLRGKLQSSGPITLANPIIAMNGPSDIRGSSEMLFTGPVQIQTGASLAVANTAGSIEFSNVISGSGGLIKTGAGSLTLGGNNTYAGGTEIQEGILAVRNGNALGQGRLKLFGGTLQASPEAIDGIRLPNPVDALTAFSNISGINSIDLDGNIWIQSGAALTVDTTPGGYFVPYWVFRGAISGPGSLKKSGDGHLELLASNSYEGGTEVREGSLGTSNEHSLGWGLVKLNGGRLIVDIGQTLANDFEINGGSFIDAGSAISSPLPVTFTGAGTLMPGSTLTVFTWSIENEYEFARPPEVVFAGPIGGAGALTKTGDGQVTFSGTAANNYTGATTVANGTLMLKKSAGVNAITGPLFIGDGVGGALTAVVKLGAANQIGDKAPISLKADGQLKMQNYSDTVYVLTNKGKVTRGDPPTLTVAFDDLTATFEGEIEGPGTLIKDGTGTWILTGINTSEGDTIVAGGTLLVDGSIGAVTVEAGATLGGSGTTGPVTLAPGAAISPGGAGPGIQKVQDLAFSTGTSYVVQLNGPDPGTGYDQLDVTGSVSLNDATLDASLGFSPVAGDNFVIIKNDGADPVVGTFAGLSQGAVVSIGGVAFHIYYDGGDGNDVVLVRNTPPAITAPGDQTAFQNVDLALGGLRVDDPEDATLTVTLQVSHGTLTLGTVAGLTVSGNGTTAVSLCGSQADLNAALGGLLYRGDHNYSGPDVLTVTASDGLETSSATVAIRVKSLAELAADMQAQVEGLRAAGVLNEGQANSLVVKLDLEDNEGDIGRVQAFLNEVDALLRASILSSAQADALLTPGNILLTGLRRR